MRCDRLFQQYSIDWRGHAVHIFTNIVNTCDVIFVQQHLQPAISVFCEKFIGILSKQNNPTNDTCDLKTNIVEAITTLVQNIPKCVSNFLPRLLPVIWKTLIGNAQVYQENNVSRSVGNADGMKFMKNPIRISSLHLLLCSGGTSLSDFSLTL